MSTGSVAAGSTPADAALAALAAAHPRDIPRASSSTSSRPVRSLAAKLAAAGLVAKPADDDDVACLHAVFDAALAGGLGCVVLDYVMEVCGDPLMTSSDPVEAYLADGACVVAWCEGALGRVRAGLEAAAAAASTSRAAPDAAPAATAAAGLAAQMTALVPVAAALASGDGGDGGGDSSPAALHASALRLQQAADVLAWATAAGVGGRSRYASPAEWGSALVRRRGAADAAAAAAGGADRRAAFVDALLADAAAGPPSYPPPAPTPVAAIPALFLSGDATPAGRRACLALFAYALADAAGPGGDASGLTALGAAFGVPPSTLAQWRLAALLDEAAAGGPGGAAALEAAVASVPAAASPSAPWQLGAALVGLGRPDAGLALLRARGAATPATSVEEALAGLDARLACGLLAEAYTEARAYWEGRPPGGGGAAAAAALVTRLAAQAAGAGALPSVCLLPLAPPEEAALAAWLAGGEGADALAAALFHLQRGRVPEALGAAAAGSGSRRAGGRRPAGLATTPAGRAALDLLRAAAQALPPAQRALVVVAAGGGEAAAASLAGPGEPLPDGAAPLTSGLADAPPVRVVVAGGADAPPPFATSTGADPWVAGDDEGGGGAAGVEGGPPPPAPVLTLPPVLVGGGGGGGRAVPAWRSGGGEAFLAPAPGMVRKRARVVGGMV